MRFAPPFIADVIAEAAAGASQLIGVIMSPQYSPIIMSGYVRTLEDAVKDLHRDDLALKIARDWHLQPYFLQAIAERVQQALNRFPAEVRERVPVLLTAHSMPKRVIEKEPNYINHLKETAAAVAELVGLPPNGGCSATRVLVIRQKSGSNPTLPISCQNLKRAGHSHVLIAPVQFLADHLEILYDIEIGAREQAEMHGIQFARTESLNTSPLFIKALASIVHSTLAGEYSPLDSKQADVYSTIVGE